MQYQSIEELNLADAVRLLEDARRTSDIAKIERCKKHLRQQLECIQHYKPALYEKYVELLA